MRLKLELRDVASLILPDAQSKRHDDTDIRRIVASIERFGFNDPIGVLPDGRIVEGTGRLMAAQMLGMTQVPVLVLTGMTKAQADLYRIAHNKITLSGTFDFEKLAAEMLAVMGEDITFEQLGFSEDHADNILRMFSGAAGQQTREVDLSYEIVWDDAAQRAVWEQFIKAQRTLRGIDASSGSLAVMAVVEAEAQSQDQEAQNHV